MAEYIEREAALTAVDETYLDYLVIVKDAVRNIPAADVVPVSELLTLRDALYENDQITMRGIARLNMLIAKYGGYDHG